MGAVYQASDAELGITVALKVIRDTARHVSPDMEQRFKNELLFARSVTHKNVVRIHDLGEIDGTKYITMSYVEGADLATILRAHDRFPVERALRIARQVGAGLEAAHEAGVIHRDLKPANIMIAAEDRALIMDFGISAAAGQADSGSIVGTLEYMAPEQGAGLAVDQRADIYAFGLILYEMLSGLRSSPDTVEGRIQRMRTRCTEGLPPLRTLNPNVPQPLESFVMKCIEREPWSRYATSAEMNAGLARLNRQGVMLPQLARLTRRTVAVSLIVVVGLLAGTYFAGRRLAPAAPAPHSIVRALVTDFENRSGNSSLDGPLGEALSIALEGAPFVQLYSPRDARTLAKQLSPNRSDRLTRETGLLIARREALNLLVEGSIDKQSSGYRVGLQAIDAANAAVLISATEGANDAGSVLTALDRLSRRIRVALGESKSEMDKAAAAETFTAGSLEAMQAYLRAQELANNGRVQEALSAYREAVVKDPQFGRAYSGAAVIYRNLGQMDQAEATFNEALKHVDRMTEREKYRTLGAYYFAVAGNYRKAAETYEALLAKYPFDQAGLSNLALSYSSLRDFAKAREISARLVATFPNDLLGRNNYAAYALYAGAFDEAVEQVGLVLKQNDKYQFAFLPLALAQSSKGDIQEALRTYGRLQQLNDFGASLAKLGIADLEMYQGRYHEADTALRESISADQSRGDKPAAAQKYIALAEAQIALGRTSAALDAARVAASLDSGDRIQFPAALALISAGAFEQAQTIAARFASRLEAEPRSYANLVAAEIARAQHRLPRAIDLVVEAQQRHDSWFSRFLLGRLYEEVEPPHHAEAMAELELAVSRRGEGADAFVADMPTLRYVPPAHYWLGRAQEGVHSTSARASYDQYIGLRARTDVNDPLLTDARKRVESLSR